MPFTASLFVEFLDDGDRVRVLAPFTYVDKFGRAWDVPSGLVSDGASIPRALWATIGSPFTGRYRRAALAHDAAYADPGIVKAQADLMLREAAIEDGCDPFLAELIYQGVRLGGQGAFADDQWVAAAELLKGMQAAATAEQPSQDRRTGTASSA